MPHDVFVSHSAKDGRAAALACGALEAEGIRCWIAPRDVSPGTPWAEALVTAIRSSRVMLLILSAATNESEHVVREVSAAADARIPILPVLVERTVPTGELGYFIQRSQWLDASEPPLEGHLGALRDAVRRILDARPPEGRGGSSGGSATPAPRAPRVGFLGSSRARRVALVSLVVVALLGAVFAWSRRKATLLVQCVPAQCVALLDGAPAGTTPLVLCVPPGRHGLLLRHPGFEDWSTVVDVAAGERASFSSQLVAQADWDASTANLLGRPLGVSLPRYPLPKGQRAAGEGEPVELILPRGRVRPDDLATLVMDVDAERVAPTGELALRRGDTTLWSVPYEPRGGLNEIPLSPDVRAAARVGDTLTWGWWPTEGPPVTVTIQVAPKDAAPLLRTIDERLAAQPAGVRAHLRAQTLLDRHLPTGAYLEAWALLRTDARDLRAAAVMEQALARSGAGESRVAASLRGALRSAPPADRERVFEPEEPPTPPR